MTLLLDVYKRQEHAVSKLVEKKLVCEVGRLDAPGKPILFGTTEDFLRYFGFKSVSELPPLEDDTGLAEQEEEEEEEEEEDVYKRQVRWNGICSPFRIKWTIFGTC